MKRKRLSPVQKKAAVRTRRRNGSGGGWPGSKMRTSGQLVAGALHGHQLLEALANLVASHTAPRTENFLHRVRLKVLDVDGRKVDFDVETIRRIADLHANLAVLMHNLEAQRFES